MPSTKYFCAAKKRRTSGRTATQAMAITRPHTTTLSASTERRSASEMVYFLTELMKIEEAALPGVGTCSMLGTANTMSCLAEALGMSLPGCGLAHAVSAKKRRIAKQSGRRIGAMGKEDLTPRKIMTREALRNAIRVSMAMGASTNSTLHLPAIAHEAGIHITLDDFDELSREIPYLCNIKPSGQYPLSVLEEQGGVPAVMKALERKLDLEQMTVSGKTVGDNKSRSAFHQLIHAILNKLLGTGINGTGCFIKDQYRRISNSGSCNCQKLALSLGQFLTVSA